MEKTIRLSTGRWFRVEGKEVELAAIAFGDNNPWPKGSGQWYQYTNEGWEENWELQVYFLPKTSEFLVWGKYNPHTVPTIPQTHTGKSYAGEIVKNADFVESVIKNVGMRLKLPDECIKECQEDFKV